MENIPYAYAVPNSGAMNEQTNSHTNYYSHMTSDVDVDVEPNPLRRTSSSSGIQSSWSVGGKWTTA